MSLPNIDPQKVNELKLELQRIACAKDFDVIYAIFKPDLDINELEENKEDEENEEEESEKTRDESITTPSSPPKPVHDEGSPIANLSALDPTQQAQIQENAMKVLKQHLEIVKLKEELEASTKEKEDLEEEVSMRNREIYEMNEKIMLMELNHSNARQQDLNTIQDLKYLLERQGKLEQNQYDFSKLKDSLERLK